MTKAVAIFGFAPQTRGLVKQSTAEECWSLNHFYNYGLEESRVTRTFEMHDLWMQYTQIQRGTAADHYWDWLQKKQPFPIYMHKVKQDYLDDLAQLKSDLYSYKKKPPADVLEKLGTRAKEIQIGLDFFGPQNKAEIRKFPFKEICDDVIPKIDGIDTETFPERGIKPYFISTIDYMIALAVYERFERIELYGVELRENTEWFMQKPGATYWIGVAHGRGIEVWTPKISVLIKAPLYGLEGGDQLIPIQIPEQRKKEATMMMDQHRNQRNFFSGKFTELNEEIQKLEKPLEHDPVVGQLAKLAQTYIDLEEACKANAQEELLKEYEAKRAEHVLAYKNKLAEVQAEAAKRLPGLHKKRDELRQQIENHTQAMLIAEGHIQAYTAMIDHENMKLDPLNLTSITRLIEVGGRPKSQKEAIGNSGGTCSYCGIVDGPITAMGVCAQCGHPMEQGQDG